MLSNRWSDSVQHILSMKIFGNCVRLFDWGTSLSRAIGVEYRFGIRKPFIESKRVAIRLTSSNFCLISNSTWKKTCPKFSFYFDFCFNFVYLPIIKISYNADYDQKNRTLAHSHIKRLFSFSTRLNMLMNNTHFLAHNSRLHLNPLLFHELEHTKQPMRAVTNENDRFDAQRISIEPICLSCVVCRLSTIGFDATT